jgi:hypothetical protein
MTRNPQGFFSPFFHFSQSEHIIDMKPYHEQNDEMQKEQESRPGWIGKTDVELARLVYYVIECYLDNPNEESMVHSIAKTLQRYRTY